jgi:hypothetical protein
MALIEGGKKAGGFHYWCPGCKEEHYVRVFPKNGPHPRWTWNESWDAPSFSPSVRHFYDKPGELETDPKIQVTTCHYFVTDGQIRYCADCQHDLSGKTVEMIDLEAGRKGEYKVKILGGGAPPQSPGARAPTMAERPHLTSRPTEPQAGVRPPPRPLAPAPRPPGPPRAPQPPPVGLRLWQPRAQPRPPTTVSRFPIPPKG